MKIAVLGSGNGGCAVAFDCSYHGYAVNLFDFESFPRTIADVQTHGGIYSEGQLQGFAPVAYAGHDIQRALQDVNVIYVVGPAYSTRPFAEACKPYLKPHHVVIICPSSCGGAFDFKRAAGLDFTTTKPLVAETATLPYAVRMSGPAKIKVHLKLKGGLYIAALPSSESQRAIDAISRVYPAALLAKNVMQTSLQNGNPVIHSTVMLLNAALIEQTGSKMVFYEEGVTESVGRLIKAVDEERIAVGRALGVHVLPEPQIAVTQGYSTEATYERAYSEGPGFQGIKAPSSLDNRYFHEDVGYGLVL